MAVPTDEIAERLGRNSKMVVAEDYEIVRQQTVYSETSYRNGEPFEGGCLTKDWLSVRLSHRGRPGFACTTDLSETGLARVVEEAFHLAGEASGDPYFRFPLWKDLRDQTVDNPEPDYPSWYGEDFSDGVLRESYRKGTVETEIRRKHEARSRFHRARQHRAELEWTPLSEPGLAFRAVRGRQRPIEGLDRVARDLALQAEWARGAGQCELRRSSLVLSPSAVIQLLELLPDWFAADRVRRGESPLASEGDGPLFSPVISLRDVGDYPDAFHSSPFDLEGVPRGETPLVERGYLRSYLYDTYHATQENRRSTGNLWRGTEESWPRIQGSTLVVLPHTASPQELLSEMHRGIWVTRLRDLSWEQRRFRCEILGWRVEDGRLVEPVRGQVWQGDLGDVMRRAISVGRDLTLEERCAAPSIFFENVPLR